MFTSVSLYVVITISIHCKLQWVNTRDNGSSSHGTEKILGMPTEEKTAEIENDSSFYTTLYSNQVRQKTEG